LSVEWRRIACARAALIARLNGAMGMGSDCNDRDDRDDEAHCDSEEECCQP
jgi:hypothetical protein